MEIVLATGNRDKIREIEAILAPIDVTLVRPQRFGRLPEVTEDGATFEANAIKKARTIRDVTGLCALADDSGLEVDALGGEPGVHSSRYAGDGATYSQNNQKLLRALDGTADDHRTARFRCVMALALTEDVAKRVRAMLNELEGSLGSPADNTPRAGAEAGRPDCLVTDGVLDGHITTALRGESGFGYDPLFVPAGEDVTLAQLGTEGKNRISHRYRALVELRELLIRFRLAGER